MGGEGEQVLEGISVTQYKEPAVVAVGVACLRASSEVLRREKWASLTSRPEGEARASACSNSSTGWP